MIDPLTGAGMRWTVVSVETFEQDHGEFVASRLSACDSRQQGAG